MSSAEDGEVAAPAPEEVPVGNPDELTKNPEALKEAHEEMASMDVLVCGQCHTAYHFVEEFKEHKDGSNCTGKSPVRDSNESKAQVWAFLLWKCSSARENKDVNTENSWKLYQQWCRMPEAHRTAWITAGTNVQALSKFAHAKVTEIKTDDQQVPVQSPTTQEVKKGRGRPRKFPRVEDSETQPSGEESDGLSKFSPKKPPAIMRVPAAAANKAKQDLLDKDSVRNAQERVPPEDRIARRTEAGGDPAEAGQFVVEKILAKRFNPRRKQYEYLLKWEGYPHDQNTWEPVENMETCKHLLEAFEKQLARQKELKALRAQQQQQAPVQVTADYRNKPKLVGTPQFKQVKKQVDTPALTPTGRLQRSSKVKALDQVKAWCGATDDEPAAKRVKKESSDEDFSDTSSYKDEAIRLHKGDRKVNGASPKSQLDPELVKSLGLAGKGMPNIKGVIKVDPKHMPNLTTGVYIMSKSSGIMKIDSPGKLGPGLNIDQDVIRKQILAAKQKKMEEVKKTPTPKTPIQQIKKTINAGGQQVTEKTIITPSGQKIIQRTIQRTPVPDTKSPVNLLNKRLAQGENSLLRRGGGSGRGRGRGGTYTVATSAGNIVRVREKSITQEFEPWSEASSDTSDGIEDPFPKDLPPIPSPSPERELTICPETGRRLARAEGEPTPPPTPSPPPTPPPAEPVLMKVEMSPGGTTGMLVQGDGAQPSLPVLTDEDALYYQQGEVKVEAGSMKQLLEQGVHSEAHEHPPIMIRGEDGVLYQVAGENEDGQTLLVAAEGVEGVEGAEGGEGAVATDSDGVMYVTREDGQQEMVSLDGAALAALMPGAAQPLQQVAVQVEGEPGEDAAQVIAQIVQTDLPSPGGTRRVVLLLPDGSLTMTELDKEQYESITEAGKQE
ncbi:unnamed protein product [Plutella xylostella]|uniref:(diamondback moth) hypothetical protein n=1 Tax=Plutella xylostella TaxID=51655 RepID=A0A8S4FCE9_PLUXY|nr:unnamed protein product [Plutella xylostella]